MADSLPKARIATVRKFNGVDDYGFSISGKKEKGYFKVKSVNADSPVACAGILANDYIIELNGIDAGPLTYEETLSQIKINPTFFSLMVLQPFERHCIEARGVKLSSESVSAVRFEGRTNKDDTATDVAKGMAPSEAVRNLLRADAATVCAINKKNLSAVAAL